MQAKGIKIVVGHSFWIAKPKPATDRTDFRGFK
jgi:hypothetical protein